MSKKLKKYRKDSWKKKLWQKPFKEIKEIARRNPKRTRWSTSLGNFRKNSELLVKITRENHQGKTCKISSILHSSFIRQFFLEITLLVS